MKNKFYLLSGLVMIAIFMVACGAQAEETHTELPHWTYEGQEGPDHWGELDPAYTLCATGTHQSPIDVASAQEQDLANIVFHYQPSVENILNNGHTVQVNYDAGSYIELDGVRYDVLQFHYHAPSEHTVNGETFPAELHIVHKNAAGNLAVVGILLKEGAENSAYQPFLDHLPAQKTEARDTGVKIDAAALLPAVQTTYRYSGSLTTPPCSEGVSWLLMTTPVELSADQLSKLEGLFELNNRPVQPLNDRSLEEDSTP
jgi:carbonic anhydrase